MILGKFLGNHNRPHFQENVPLTVGSEGPSPRRRLGRIYGTCPERLCAAFRDRTCPGRFCAAFRDRPGTQQSISGRPPPRHGPPSPSRARALAHATSKCSGLFLFWGASLSTVFFRLLNKPQDQSHPKRHTARFTRRCRAGKRSGHLTRMPSTGRGFRFTYPTGPSRVGSGSYSEATGRLS